MAGPQNIKKNQDLCESTQKDQNQNLKEYLYNYVQMALFTQPKEAIQVPTSRGRGKETVCVYVKWKQIQTYREFCQTRYHTPVILTLGKLGQEECEFQASWDTEQNSVSVTKINKQEILILATKWINFVDIILREITEPWGKFGL